MENEDLYDRIEPANVDFVVVSADKFGGGAVHGPRLNSGSWFNGSMEFSLWCEGE